jgi:hypothetical protein
MAVLRRYFRLEHGVLVAVAMVAIALKLTLTSGHLLPGYDEAYYWVQVRSLLTNGRLAFDDLPLVFWVQSLLAVLMGDIPLAVRISDALLPALAAVPVWVLYHDGHKKNWYVFPVLLMAVLLHPIQLYYFTGDFIKNASAVPLAMLLGWWLTQHTAESNWRTVLGTAVTCIVIALTHFGVLLLCVSIVAVWLCAHALRDSPRLLVIRLGSLILLATLFVLLLLIFVPERFARLIGIFGDVSLLFTNPLGLLMYFGIPRVTRPDIVFACIAGQLGAVLLGLCAWRNRAHLSDNVRAVVSAFVLTAFVFSSPLLSIEIALRLTALSFVPLLLAAMVLWLRTTDITTQAVVCVLLLSTLVVSAVIYPRGATPPVLRQSEWQDFQVMVNTVTIEQPALVVAPHGINFLVAWYLNTHVAGEDVAVIDSTQQYRAHYVLAIRGSSAKTAQTNPRGSIVYENDTFMLSRTK